MPAYFFVDIREIKDRAKMDEYRARVSPVVEKFGGRYLIVGGPFEVVEGDWRPVFPVLVEFPSMDQARRWYDSEEYRELKQMRLAATAGSGVFMEGRLLRASSCEPRAITWQVCFEVIAGRP